MCSSWLTSTAGPPTAQLTSEHLVKNEGDVMCLPVSIIRSSLNQSSPRLSWKWPVSGERRVRGRSALGRGGARGGDGNK